MNATIRHANRSDAEAIADVHNRSRAEAYRGLIADDILFGEEHTYALAQAWREFFTDPVAGARVAVAEVGSQIVGFAYALPADGPAPIELHNLYMLEKAKGTGAATMLLDAVVEPGEPAFLWVAEWNERAQAFYRKHGFALDGAEAFHESDQITVKRMARG